MDRPDDATWQWIQDQIGTVEIVLAFAHSHGYSRLWRLKTATGHAWLKMHTYPAKWAGEVHALVEWGPTLGRTPQVLAFRTEPRAVLLTELPGRPAEKTIFSADAELRMWSQAGDWLRRLHERESDWFGATNLEGGPSGPPSYDPVEYVQASFDSVQRQGSDTGILSSDELGFVAVAAKEWLPSLQNERARAIHRDFTPRNWMCGPDGELTGVIDFEHARWDVRAADMNRWWDWDFRRRPALKDAFFESYGELTDELMAQIEVLCLLAAAGGTIWATKVKDEPFARRNREALHRTMEKRDL